MKLRNALGLAVVIAAGVALGGCRTAPVQNVTDAPVVVSGSTSQEAVKQAIIRAGSGLGWIMRPQEPGHIVGTLNIRTHMAKVDVIYDESEYDIVYKDSNNLKYDGDSIHSNYNGWIQNLSTAINNQLAAL